MSELRLGLDSVVMDTDVASLFYKEQLQPALTAKLFGRHKVLPFVTVGELTKWTEVRSWGEGRVESLRRWLDASAIISGDEAVASLWGRIQAGAQRSGKSAPINDSWIAACCLSYGLPLVTLNTKDYQYFAEHHGLQLL